jgi:hypothetical protein
MQIAADRIIVTKAYRQPTLCHLILFALKRDKFANIAKVCRVYHLAEVVEPQLAVALSRSCDAQHGSILTNSATNEARRSLLPALEVPDHLLGRVGYGFGKPD